MAENNTRNKFIMNEYIDVNVNQNLAALCDLQRKCEEAFTSIEKLL
ncbi:hypothetical protein [Clostridium estertheticum]|uniref:Uncharacterized protein n=1 Tax=Clostridium estertheticum TaxID=238834 RepID=A0A7Y3SYC7_9CLOT|nr:hypothetical protein [Clostridium estertheticum]MBW9173067.1 hypothetical protein [Clostridium estertheticum]NNU77631.1 hypothetical protein [Clostridium estertheticum]WBL48072.1 hypothetical protein LOR37_05300 [Clostridium estertheticum]WLC76161.1 hypothetical protein KTC99_04910 [Clostridium estertheticum]